MNFSQTLIDDGDNTRALSSEPGFKNEFGKNRDKRNKERRTMNLAKELANVKFIKTVNAYDSSSEDSDFSLSSSVEDISTKNGRKKT